MARIKFTKGELKKTRDALRQYERYLPTLQLKKQQLQMVIRQIEDQKSQLLQKQKDILDLLQSWVALFHENTTFHSSFRLDAIVSIESIQKRKGNIAGVTIPLFDGVKFIIEEYDVDKYPLWIDAAVVVLQQVAKLDAEIATLKEQINQLNHELRITSQRVNLFEKVKIPETKENIRRISIYLGDQQTAAVVRGKIAKKKLVKVAGGVA